MTDASRAPPGHRHERGEAATGRHGPRRHSPPSRGKPVPSRRGPRREKVRGSNPLSSTNPEPRPTCGNIAGEAGFVRCHSPLLRSGAPSPSTKPEVQSRVFTFARMAAKSGGDHPKQVTESTCRQRLPSTSTSVQATRTGPSNPCPVGGKQSGLPPSWKAPEASVHATSSGTDRSQPSRKVQPMTRLAERHPTSSVTTRGSRPATYPANAPTLSKSTRMPMAQVGRRPRTLTASGVPNCRPPPGWWRKRATPPTRAQLGTVARDAADECAGADLE